MSKKNDDFFKAKKEWSTVKDDILACYFKPYVSKILHTNKPLLYVDCFAGKGKFDDGSPGSPLIALKIVDECLQATTMRKTSVETVFIDLNYAGDLKKNLVAYPSAKIVAGKYEDEICSILKGKHGRNVFLYIDPYGIKALKCAMFDQFANSRFNSIELLINLNSFGFIRAACNALGATFSEQEMLEGLVEYSPTRMDTTEQSINALNEIAGGDYWKTIIRNYQIGLIDGYEAEDQFTKQYCNRLSKCYKYVLNMPLRIKRGQRPKYRLIHATNHSAGCLLMVDNICNRWESLRDLQTGGQISFWPENCNNQAVDSIDLTKKVIDHFSQVKVPTSLSDVLAKFFVRFGPICATSDVYVILKEMEENGRAEFIRDPSVTRNGKPSTFMIEGRGKTVSVRWNT